MKISPLDIRKQTFRTVFRGADTEEVRVFLDLVASECEAMLQENVQLNERVQHCEDRLVEYRQLDQTLRSSLLTAERLSAEAKEASQREANLVYQDAEWRAKQMLEDARERLGRLTEEIRELHSKKDAFTQHLRSFLQGQMELLDRNEDFLQRIDHLSDDAQVLNSRIRQAEVRPPAAASSDTIPPPSVPPPSDRDGTGARGIDLPAGRGLGRISQGRSIDEPGQLAPAGTEESEGRPSRPGPERSEGLFEISADEEEDRPLP